LYYKNKKVDEEVEFLVKVLKYCEKHWHLKSAYREPFTVKANFNYERQNCYCIYANYNILNQYRGLSITMNPFPDKNQTLRSYEGYSSPAT